MKPVLHGLYGHLAARICFSDPSLREDEENPDRLIFVFVRLVLTRQVAILGWAPGFQLAVREGDTPFDPLLVSLSGRHPDKLPAASSLLDPPCRGPWMTYSFSIILNDSKPIEPDTWVISSRRPHLLLQIPLFFKVRDQKPFHIRGYRPVILRRCLFYGFLGFFSHSYRYR